MRHDVCGNTNYVVASKYYFKFFYAIENIFYGLFLTTENTFSC